MGIGLAVLAAVVGTFITQSKYLNVQEQINEMQQNARGAMDIMVREIKMAGYRPVGGAVVGVTYNIAQLKIQADLDGNGDSLGANEDITYSFDNANLRIMRNSGGNQILAENIQNFTFQYLDANGDVMTGPGAIRQVRLNITARTARIDPNSGGFRTYDLTAVVTPPNLAY